MENFELQYSILNTATKQVVSLDGVLMVTWKDDSIQLSGDSLFKILKETIDANPSVASFQFSDA